MTKPRILESKVQPIIIKDMKALGAIAERPVINSRSGEPDLFFCYKGWFMAIEVKRDDKEDLTPLQKCKIRKIQDAGGFAFGVLGLAHWRTVIKPLIMEIRKAMEEK